MLDWLMKLKETGLSFVKVFKLLDNGIMFSLSLISDAHEPPTKVPVAVSKHPEALTSPVTVSLSAGPVVPMVAE